MEREEMLSELYAQFDEDDRLCKSRQGQLEYLVTMNYIRKFLFPGCRVLEIGAGTGRYSVALAKEGFRVTAVELVESNLNRLKENAKGLAGVDAFQGDALDLGRFANDTFDVTLVFGPLYHLYDRADQHRALDEAIRVTKPGGAILAAFLSAHAIICTNYLYDRAPTAQGIRLNFDGDYTPLHFPEQVFTGFDVCEFEALFREKPVEQITTVAADSVLEIAEGREDFFMTDEDFAAFADYQLHVCEKRELLGLSSHLVYICRKRQDSLIRGGNA
ncbi:MAG: class I SAM-dependent methyltransferase [Clostridia bacterium]|nr:class I SAM-dependent methyltransferase [Clostridia bacterium]